MVIENKIVFIISILLLLIMANMSSCYSPEEGCLDPESTNYSITGDDQCEDCCVYPVFKLSIFHESEDTTFNLMDTITNDLGQQISLLDFVYLLSDFKVYTSDSESEVQDTISLNVNDGVQLVKDDIIRVSRSVFTYELGTIIFDGVTTQISFKLGLTDLLNENRFTTAVEDHPLTTDPDSLYQLDSDTYVFQRLQVAQGVDFLDTVIYDIEMAADVLFDLEFESVRGEDKTIIIETQYDQWFDGIDFDLMTKLEIEAKIAENSSGMFRQKD